MGVPRWNRLWRQFTVGGVEYRLIGASGSAKNGKYYAVNKEFEKPIAERFQQWPEAAITYFGILISPCKVRIEEPDVRVLVVEDHTLGTNDCRGWIRRSLFEKLDLPARHFYQFRLAFNRTQAKGSFKVMENDVADHIGADIILPKSSMKPALPEKSTLVRLCFGDAQLFRGPVVLGIREVSRRAGIRVELHAADSRSRSLRSTWKSCRMRSSKCGN